ncbi:MAG: hypothetical protein DRQ37_00855 [Gammaproteobacteria bacterium]|nr:MAG: hypothetical protein DRQ37_00855 [Gammaproteobacteria bacterium]
MIDSRLIVRRERPLRSFLLALLVVNLLAAAGYMAYVSGRDTLAEEYTATRDERDGLRIDIHVLQQANTALRARAAVLERTEQIQRRAYGDVDEKLKLLQDEILALKEELAFYRGIAVTANKERALDVRSFEIKRDGDERAYRYRLVLTRVTKSDKVISGAVNLSVVGKQGGRQTTYSVIDLSNSSASELTYRLKYFQRLEGRITLPEGFVPQRVDVQVKAAQKGQAAIDKTFYWPTTG